MDQDVLVDKDFPLFSRPPKRSKLTAATSATTTSVTQNLEAKTPHVEKATNLDDDTRTTTTFADLGLAEWAVRTCKELSMRKPTPVQSHCIPKILAGRNVLGVAQTGSGKTAAFALPMLHRLAEYPFGIFALVVTPTRELAYQLAEQFRALGSCLNLRCAVVVGGMDMLTQKQSLTRRPHVVIATPGRIKVLLEDNPDIPPLFSNTKVFSFVFFGLVFLNSNLNPFGSMEPFFK
jgi:ATP-dependent RNA helicase DDX49/DBP8